MNYTTTTTAGDIKFKYVITSKNGHNWFENILN